MNTPPSVLAPSAAQESSTLDLSNPRSVVNLVPERVSRAIQDAASTNPEIFNIDEKDLYKLLKDSNHQPSPTDNRLRLKFWMEYERVQERSEKQMNISNVTAGVCSRELFYDRYLANPHKVAWLLTPPTGYAVKAEEALEFGIEQLRDILDLPHVVGGRVDTKLGELKAKIVAMLDIRVKGAIVQRSMNLNVNTSNEQVAKAATAATSADLMRQLKELEKQNQRAKNVPEPRPGQKPDIEVT